VAADLADAIARGEWRPGRRLPPMTELAELYGVARGTIRKALTPLEADGTITIVPGRGTFVNAREGTDVGPGT
jgi:DNA-binding GntR family transcriptional regulator